MQRDTYRLRRRWGPDLFRLPPSAVGALLGLVLVAAVWACSPAIDCARPFWAWQSVKNHNTGAVHVRRFLTCEEG